MKLRHYILSLVLSSFIIVQQGYGQVRPENFREFKVGAKDTDTTEFLGTFFSDLSLMEEDAYILIYGLNSFINYKEKVLYTNHVFYKVDTNGVYVDSAFFSKDSYSPSYIDFVKNTQGEFAFTYIQDDKLNIGILDTAMVWTDTFSIKYNQEEIKDINQISEIIDVGDGYMTTVAYAYYNNLIFTHLLKIDYQGNVLSEEVMPGHGKEYHESYLVRKGDTVYLFQDYANKVWDDFVNQQFISVLSLDGEVLEVNEGPYQKYTDEASFATGDFYPVGDNFLVGWRHAIVDDEYNFYSDRQVKNEVGLIDKNFNLIKHYPLAWSLYIGQFMNRKVEEIIPLRDGNFLVAGNAWLRYPYDDHTNRYLDWYPYLMKIDSLGNQLWMRYVSVFDFKNPFDFKDEVVEDCIELPSGNIICIGDLDGSHPFIYKVSKDGCYYEDCRYRFIGLVPVEDLIPEEVSVFPNPAGEQVSIRTDLKEYNLTIFNAGGVFIKNLKIPHEETTVDLSGLKAGLYYFQFSKDRKYKVVKVIKQ